MKPFKWIFYRYNNYIVLNYEIYFDIADINITYDI